MNPDALLIAVLIKDFGAAKTRLAPLLDGLQRRRLARRTAQRALRAARSVAPTLAVCGSSEAASFAALQGADTFVETAPSGQNAAAATAMRLAAERGAKALLLLSADLPLVTATALRRMLRAADDAAPVVVAARAAGREGTNALLLSPPSGFALHFGNRSLPKFKTEAATTGRRFVVVEDPALALDIDEPADLAAWRLRRPA